MLATNVPNVPPELDICHTTQVVDEEKNEKWISLSRITFSWTLMCLLPAGQEGL